MSQNVAHVRGPGGVGPGSSRANAVGQAPGTEGNVSHMFVTTATEIPANCSGRVWHDPACVCEAKHA